MHGSSLSDHRPLHLHKDRDGASSRRAKTSLTLLAPRAKCREVFDELVYSFVARLSHLNVDHASLPETEYRFYSYQRHLQHLGARYVFPYPTYVCFTYLIPSLFRLSWSRGGGKRAYSDGKHSHPEPIYHGGGERAGWGRALRVGRPTVKGRHENLGDSLEGSTYWASSIVRHFWRTTNTLGFDIRQL